MIMLQRKKHINSEGIERLNKFVSDLKGVGLIEGMALNGRKGRYFLIDGHSWENACQRLGRSVAPSFIAWRKQIFLNFSNPNLWLWVNHRRIESWQAGGTIEYVSDFCAGWKKTNYVMFGRSYYGQSN